MSLVEATTNVVVGLMFALTTQFAMFPLSASWCPSTPSSQLDFKGFDAVAQRELGNLAPLCGTREVTFIVERYDIPDLGQFH